MTNEVRYTPCNLPNIGFIRSSVPEILRDDIDAEVMTMREDGAPSMRENLAGHIESEYEMTGLAQNDQFREFLYGLVGAYDQNFPMYKQVVGRQFGGQTDLVLDKVWCNYQLACEYNPIHDHSGVFSFVIFHTIPYKLETEDMRLPGKKDPRNGRFHFQYINTLGRLVDIPLNCEEGWEWEVALFPASMFHFVQPFYTSSDERITISGNLHLTSPQQPGLQTLGGML